MKVLHTSDWHLGQQFYEHDRREEHQAFFTWLLATLVEQQIDLLLVAGDIYHTATPSSSAENQLYQFIKDAKKQCPQLHVVIIAGNHDSANRILAAQPLLAQFDTHVVGRFDVSAPSDIILEVNINDKRAVIAAMPFLRSSDISSLSQTENGPSYAQGVAKAYELALNHAYKINKQNAPLIVMGHLHAKGGDISSDSERNLVIGGEESISANVFGNKANYVALGHLHKAQQVAKNDAIRYSGTPIPMSFSERNYSHQINIIEFISDEKKNISTTVNPLYIPRSADVIILPKGECVPLDELCKQIKTLDISQNTVAPYLRVKLKSSDTDTTFREQIEQALEGKNVKFCGIERVREQSDNTSSDAVFEDLSEVEMLNPQNLLEQAFANDKDMAGQSVPDELKALLNDVINELAEQEQL
ncbi:MULTISPECIES: exonuclease SbcCD subunit D C-terminal domain-containing protein [unclassified Pseudoalteromonas]|uniref:exonuclease SbcCD subunit D C-terminal domain-containing protein n=1 Tax=unclassified Pseudoalteromonas TaxID=194690 RepID=UPI001107BD33|nr:MULTISPECIES: exonuclease SbcCD subunit D C-terminal domain-containing protein [unclassified Pseudoalteromonas]TMN84723.1 exonuclease sbcCD subunit D [Pseudoalteromonas sp. S410]TMN91060.1 exonuclease sbcCD subunit D [Pseudoalteromonas sp. S408]TMN97939.1 exonuclease sbcCD subunit D [Pseudoalteromonas sp. S407]TMO01263.1 exonuclease sbcCD subunit D [Pseudoalteromonas sp. S409]TMO09258.1 exonuclease sbcCD subunit D [Pseudoalteromonas sp. S186]